MRERKPHLQRHEQIRLARQHEAAYLELQHKCAVAMAKITRDLATFDFDDDIATLLNIAHDNVEHLTMDIGDALHDADIHTLETDEEVEESEKEAHTERAHHATVRAIYYENKL